jgi:hypothetical protein
VRHPRGLGRRIAAELNDNLSRNGLPDVLAEQGFFLAKAGKTAPGHGVPDFELRSVSARVRAALDPTRSGCRNPCSGLGNGFIIAPALGQSRSLIRVT